MRPSPLAACALLMLASGNSLAGSCEAIRSQIDAKIRAGGVAVFTLDIVDAAAPAPGKTVGTCERGAKKIVYRAGAAPARPPQAAVITECKDGSSPIDGNCKKK
jgi:hypothetical protein